MKMRYLDAPFECLNPNFAEPLKIPALPQTVLEIWRKSIEEMRYVADNTRHLLPLQYENYHVLKNDI